MDPVKVRKYLKVSAALKAAYEELKLGKITRSGVLTEMYEPLLNKMNQQQVVKRNVDETEKEEEVVPEKLSEEEVEEEEGEEIGSLANKFLQMSRGKTIKTDNSFGIYELGDELYIGNMPVKIINDDIVFADGYKYEGTEGLWELLTLEKPENFTDSDYEDYCDIVLRTDCYKQNNDPDEVNFKSSRGSKWKNIIKPMLLKYGIIKDKKKKVEGSGLQKILTNKPVEYVYYNTLDELLEKLYILSGEIKAGNTNPSLYNEIVSIVEEILENELHRRKKKTVSRRPHAKTVKKNR